MRVFQRALRLLSYPRFRKGLQRYAFFYYLQIFSQLFFTFFATFFEPLKQNPINQHYSKIIFFGLFSTSRASHDQFSEKAPGENFPEALNFFQKKDGARGKSHRHFKKSSEGAKEIPKKRGDEEKDGMQGGG